MINGRMKEGGRKTKGGDGSGKRRTGRKGGRKKEVSKRNEIEGPGGRGRRERLAKEARKKRGRERGREGQREETKVLKWDDEKNRMRNERDEEAKM